MNRIILRTYLAARFATSLLLACPPAYGDVLEISSDGTVVMLAADRPHASASATPVAASAYRPALEEIASAHALNPALLEAVVWQESRWNTAARSVRGAIGLAQLMPDTARELGVDPHDPVANLEGGARYLRRQLDRFGDLRSALAAYNAGPGRVIAAGGVPPIPETRTYVDAILGRIAQSRP